MPNKPWNRRQIIKNASLAGVTGIAYSQTVLAASCELTPPQTSGPFYPEPQHQWEDNDLIQKLGSNGTANGVPLVLWGHLTEGDACKALVGAKVEIWQADNQGKYKHSGDNRPVPLDPNFQYFGKVITDNTGRYYFRTIVPGKYPGRTPHIHFRVVTRDGRQLVSQLYFSQYAQWNKQDGIYRSLLQAGVADRVTTTFGKSRRFRNAYSARWDISISSKTRLTPFID